jgi:hypothetical protein
VKDCRVYAKLANDEKSLPIMPVSEWLLSFCWKAEYWEMAMKYE